MDKMLSLMDAFVNNAKVEELESIKAEVEKEREEMANTEDWGRYYGLNLSLEIIDNHIENLKGDTE